MRSRCAILLACIPLLSMSIHLAADVVQQQPVPQYVAPPVEYAPPVVYPQYPVYYQPYVVDPGQRQADDIYRSNQHPPQ